MTLYDWYRLQEHRTVNCKNLATPEPWSLLFEYKWIQLVTLDPDMFEGYSPGYLREIFDIQNKSMMSELNIQLKYMMTSRNEANRTKKQYDDLYFFEKEWKFYAFEKHRLLSQSQKTQNKARTVMSRNVQKDLFTESIDQNSKKFWSSDQTKVELDDEWNIIRKKLVHSHQLPSDDEFIGLADDEVDKLLDDSNDPRPSVAWSPILNYLPSGAIGVSVQAIRDITWYSWTVQMPWHTQPVEISWQKRFMLSNATLQVVDWSRQW
jgi:hypothetical protein